MFHPSSRALIVIIAVFATTLLRCSSPDESTDLVELVQPGAAADFNLLLITLDTVRSDRLGCYGHEQAETPNTDALAATGVLFADAITPAPTTLPSHATMLTGLAPPGHGIRDNGNFFLAEEHLTIAERLQENGYDTAAFIASFILDERFGLNQGFDVYDFEVTPEIGANQAATRDRRHAGAVTDAAIRWLRGRQQARPESPFFMWVHYYDAHVPYVSPNTKQPRFADRPYDGEIAFVDTHLGRLLGQLDHLRLRDNTLIALVTDHGEGLGEHGEATHGILVYGATMRAAMILSCPTLFPTSARIGHRVVSLVDLCPTLEDLLGLPPRGDGASDGISLFAAGDPDRAVYIETYTPYYAARCSPLRGLRTHVDKLILGPEPEYFDLTVDPGELENRHAADSERVIALAVRLDERLAGWRDGSTTAAGTRTLSPDEIARLAALGYVHQPGADGTETSLDDLPDDLPDPKAMIRSKQKIKQAFGLLRNNRWDEALRTSREAVRACPAYADASTQLAMIYDRMGRQDKAAQALQELLDRRPDMQAAIELARLHVVAGRYDAMEETLAVAAELEPDNGLVHIIRGDRYGRDERWAEAIAEYEEALRIDEQRIGDIARRLLERARTKADAGQ